MRARLILDGPRGCAENMAVDEALLRAWRPGSPPVVRIYFWSPTGLSIGRTQPLSSVRIDEALSMGWCVVRRPTGGAAIVHPERLELTYSVVVSTAHPGLPAGVEASAAAIARALVYALRILGVDAELSPTRYRREGPPLCYARGGAASVTVKGFRVSGSAQLRLGDRLLQHGTLVLHVEPGEWARVLGMTVDAVWSSVRGLYDLGYEVDVGDLVDAVRKGFERVLGVELAEDGLAPDEEELAASLTRRYASREWLEGL